MGTNHEDTHINESILSEEILEDQKKNRIDHMTYLPGMEDIGSEILDQVVAAMEAYDYNTYTAEDVKRALAHTERTPEDFQALLSPAALPFLEEIAQAAQMETRKHFGNSVYMFTPIYIANYCENYCIYCGFNCHNKINRAQLNAEEIEKEMEERVRYFKSEDKLIEAQRIAERTNFDVEMMKETGFCSGIENYSRHLTGLEPGKAPYTLIDFFGDDFLMIVDESHITIPQVRGMYAGDRSRKQTLVDFGFRLPSALDNRPLNFDEFEERIDQMLFVSATPNVYEGEHEMLRAEQIIRPTGLLDPPIDVRPVEGQIDDLISEINKEVEKKHKVLVTTLTKRMAEDLTAYMKELDIRVKYLHSDIDTLERIEIVRDLRMDVFDVLVGINLLREGLDIPEVTLIAILDADKEGFLRSETSLVQTVGRAARNAEGHVIMYGDTITDSMRAAITETKRRREIQMAYNEEHGITPTTIRKAVRDVISITNDSDDSMDGIGGKHTKDSALKKDRESMNRKELTEMIAKLTKKMNKAAAELNFEEAAELRDELKKYKIALRDYED